MIQLTDLDIINLIRKNNLNADTLQEEVVKLLAEKGLKLATAESCTGGLISERITRVSGASEVFDCGICSYANHIKQKVLGVSETTLSILGAVSAETAVQMAEGVKKLSGADIGVSTTGVAGPTGGTPEKPVGLVFVGVCTAKESYAIRLNLGGNSKMPNTREYIRRVTSDAVLFTVLDAIHNNLQ
jgi:PncC family amidohydrolase